jgi:hypothetical protein
VKTISGLGAGGAALVIWKSIPTWSKVMLIGGIVTLTIGELVIDVNHAINAPEMFQGQAAGISAEARQKQAVADAANTSIADIKTRLERGEKVTVAESQQLKEYEIKEAEARIKRAEATNQEIGAIINSAIFQFVGGMVKAAQGK